jgi:hypothetical protein
VTKHKVFATILLDLNFKKGAVMKKEKTEDSSRQKFSCKEARLVLSFIPVTKSTVWLRQVEKDAIGHYVLCKICRDEGIEGVLSKTINCEDAVLQWAERPCALWQVCSPDFFQPERPIFELLAVEHV